MFVHETACEEYIKKMSELKTQPGFQMSAQQNAILGVLDTAKVLYAERRQMDNLSETQLKQIEKLKRKEETKNHRERMKALTAKDRIARRKASYTKYNMKRRAKELTREEEIEELRQSLLGKGKKKPVRSSTFIDDEANEVIVEDDSEYSEESEECSSGGEYEYEPVRTGKHRKKRAVRSEDDEDVPMPQYRSKKKSSRSAPVTPYDFPSPPTRPLPTYEELKKRADNLHV